MDEIKYRIRKSIVAKEAMLSKCSKAIEQASNAMYQAVKKDKKILWCGNGGSAADSQHMAAELMGGLISHDRAPIPSIALTTDTIPQQHGQMTLTMRLFFRQVEGLGHEGDVLLAISTSGNSINVINAVIAAKRKE